MKDQLDIDVSIPLHTAKDLIETVNSFDDVDFRWLSYVRPADVIEAITMLISGYGRRMEKIADLKDEIETINDKCCELLDAKDVLEAQKDGLLDEIEQLEKSRDD